MPTTYAHWRFGCECIETLPQNLKQIVHRYRELFDLGVHGPDIFFYDLRHSDVSRYGYAVHEKPGRDFFERAIKVYKETEKDKEAMLAYLLGFLSHFTFDSQSHGYVERKKEVSGISHNKIEAEYDGYLMRQEGKAVNRVNRSASLKPSRFAAEIIARFFPFDEDVMLRTTRWQHLIIRTLFCKTSLKRNFIRSTLEKLNKLDDRDLIVEVNEMEGCKDSNLRMDKLKANALLIYPELVNDLMNALNSDEKLPAYFDHDFGPWPDYQEIPILTLSEELEYKPELRK